ncbi:MAG: type II secretion system F family protein [Rhodoferax sp.]|nr:type II secretion system F family protein [Rhodoferax sp.]
MTQTPLPSRVRADMFSQLAAMERAGLPTATAWGLLNLPSVQAARLQTVQKAVTRGSSPAMAVLNAQLFTALEGSLIRAASAAGSPAHAYQRLAESCSRKSQIEGKIRSRMALPAATLVLALLIQPLPPLVAGTLTAGSYLMQVLKPLISIAIMLALARWALKSGQFSAWLLRVPLYGKAIARGDAINFFESLALLLEAGVPMFEALPTAVATIENSVIRSAYARIKPSMQRGVPLSTALAEEISDPMHLGNPHVIEFIATGEGSGTLPEMLFRHVKAEVEALSEFWKQVADWLPRIAYSAVACWIVFGMLTGGGFAPKVPLT